MVAAAGESDERRLGWGQLAIFSLPVLLIQAIELPWRVYMPAFLTGTLGFGLAAVGTLLATVRLFDAGFDLLVAWASDRWPTRFGRRKPWMAAGVPLIMLGAAGVFLVRPGTPLPVLVGWAVLLHVGYTMVVTPHGGWGLEVGRTARERLRVIGVKTWSAVLAVPLVMLLPSLLERAVAADRTMQMRGMGIAILVLAPAIMGLVLHRVPEPVEHESLAPAAGRRSLREDVLATIRRPFVLRIAALYALAGLAEATTSGSFIFFAEGPLGLKGWASTLLLVQAAIGLLFLPGWTLLGMHIGKQRALTAAFAVQATAMGLTLLLPTIGTAPTLMLLALRQACAGADFLFLRAMVADLAGQSIAAGRNRSASHYAAFNIALRAALSLGAGLVLWIPAMLGTSPGDGATFDQAIRLVFALPACLAAIGGILLLSRRSGSTKRFAATDAGWFRPRRPAIP